MLVTNIILSALKKETERLTGLGSEPSSSKVASISFPQTQTWS